MSDHKADLLSPEERAALHRVRRQDAYGGATVADATLVAEALNRVAPAPTPVYKLAELVAVWEARSGPEWAAYPKQDMVAELRAALAEVERQIPYMGAAWARNDVRRMLGLPGEQL